MQLYHTPPPWPLFTRARTRARAHTHAKCGGRGEDEMIHVHKGCVFVCVCARARRCVNSMSAWISWMSELHRWEEGWLNTCRPWLYTTQCRCHSHLPPQPSRRLAELTPTMRSCKAPFTHPTHKHMHLCTRPTPEAAAHNYFGAFVYSSHAWDHTCWWLGDCAREQTHMGRRERGMRNREGGSIRKNDSVPAMGQKRRLMEELAA